MNPAPDIIESSDNKYLHKPKRKKRRSKLDAYTTELLQMDRDKKTIPEMLDWLDKQGTATSHTNVSQFLIIRREEAAWQEQQERLQVRARKCTALEEWVQKNPAPDLGAVVKMFQMMMMEMAAGEALPPETLKLADRLMRTAMKFAYEKNRADYRERKLFMEEQKHEEWVKCEQSRAFEFCLREAKQHPHVVDLYRAAFDALEAVNSPALSRKDEPECIPMSCRKQTTAGRWHTENGEFKKSQ